MSNEQNVIKFSLYLKGWSYESGQKSVLRETAKKITPLEFHVDMRGDIFCPECFAPLFRSPGEKDFATNGRKAFFAHSRGIQTECSLRVKRTEGKKYENEEEAKKAIENRELVVVNSFMREKPESPRIEGPVVYDQGPNEDESGPVTAVAIGRHSGEGFMLPSKITTIRGLCRSFDENLKKYFLLPGQQAANTLADQLISISEVTDVCDVPRLYVGRIKYFKIHPNRKPWNIRQIFFDFPSNGGYRDFCLKVNEEGSREHGIDDGSKERVVLAYGKVTISGTGLSIENLGWGEFSLLPVKYEYLLDSI